MVFVTIGTQKQQFDRLMKLLENSKELKNEDIVVQAGYTKYENEDWKILDFIPAEEIENYMKQAEFVICHGGVGSIFTALRLRKKVLVVPRLEKYGEHINDHQLEICEQLEKEGYILYLKQDNDFDKLVRKVKKRNAKMYRVDHSFLDKLRKEI